MARPSKRPAPAQGSWAATLKAWRAHAGLTQVRAANTLKVALRTYQQWEGQDYQPSVITPAAMRQILKNTSRE